VLLSSLSPAENSQAEPKQPLQVRRNYLKVQPRFDMHHPLISKFFLKTCCSIVAMAALMVEMPFSSRAEPPLVYSAENTGTNYPAPPLPTLGHLPLIQPLPDPFYWASDPLNAGGTSSTNFADWEHHRAEILAQIQNYEIGTKPAVNPSQVTASYANGMLTVNITNNGQGMTLTCPVSFPSGNGPFPVCIGMDQSYGSLQPGLFTSRNIAGITYRESQVSTYGSPQNTDPFYRLYGPAQNTSNTGQYAAWIWGVSRVIDGLYALNGILGTNQIDLTHIAVTGCSYAGKLALYSGAFDERIALTVAQESGGGGANSWRYNHTEPSGSVENIDNTDYHWFSSARLQQFAGNNVSYLPEDHHELDALVAPRALYITGNTDYTWLGNPSCYVCSRAVQQIFNTLGIPDRFGFNVDGGHSHCTFPNDQTNDLAYFLDKFMLAKTNLSSVIASYPGGYNSINYSSWYQWWGTANPIFPTLYLSIPAATTKGAGTLAGQGNVSVSGITSSNLVVSLSTSDTTKVTVPATVTIPAGQSNVVFDLTILTDSLLNGNQTVYIYATAPNFPKTANATITIHDTNSATLSVALPASASESAGTVANAGSVSIGTVAAADFTVSLNSSDPSRLIVPSTTVISTGQTSAVFNLTFVDNKIIGGSGSVSVTAHVPNWTDGSNSMAILYDDPMPDHFVWSPISSSQLIGEPFPVTIKAQDIASNTLDFRLPVTLSALIVGNATGTNTILNSPGLDQSLNDGSDYVLGYSFTPNTNLKVTGVRSCFGDEVSIWTTNGRLLVSQNVVSVSGTWVDTPLPAPLLLYAGVTYVIVAHENGVEYFWGQSLPATFPDGAINQSWWDYGNGFPTQTDGSAWYYVDLRYAKDVVSVPVNPGATANFSGGTWSGNVAVLQAATNVMLQASAGGGVGTSNPFNVLGTPKLAIAASSNSVVLSWPAAAAGFNLQQASTLPNWTNAPVTPTIMGDHYYVTTNVGPAGVYYRLRKP
jgi:hypothetical protein